MRFFERRGCVAVHDVLADALRVVRDKGLLLVPRAVRGAVHAVARGASHAADLRRARRRKAAGSLVQEDAHTTFFFTCSASS